MIMERFLIGLAAHCPGGGEHDDELAAIMVMVRMVIVKQTDEGEWDAACFGRMVRFVKIRV